MGWASTGEAARVRADMRAHQSTHVRFAAACFTLAAPMVRCRGHSQDRAEREATCHSVEIRLLLCRCLAALAGMRRGNTGGTAQGW
eukprot:6175721-Pleurochrysis_carterae.AAC.2